MELMKQAIAEHALPAFPGPFSVLDVGSQAVNGHASYRSLMPAGATYIGLDIAEGHNVDVVVADPYHWRELGGRQFDLIISGQCLEHVEYPWETMMRIAEHLHVGGLAIIIAPSIGREHRYPIDTFRYYPDGMKALARWALLTPVSCWVNERSTVWRDCILIARRDA
jgi:SAM-dependent methyltransferase